MESKSPVTDITAFCILGRSGCLDVRQLNGFDLEALFNKTQTDIFSTRNELMKLKRINKPSQADHKQMSQLLEKLDVRQRYDATILKVKKDLFSYTYLEPKVKNVDPVLSANDKSITPIANSSQPNEVAPSVLADDNQTL